MFSVIIPIYNKADYLHNSILSVINQSFPDFELILVNDGSTDNSINIISNISDHRITIINQENLGASAARNRGAIESKYEYLTFLDADDWWHPDFLTELVNLIFKFPDAILYGTNYYYIRRGKRYIEYKGLPRNFHSGYIDYISVYGKSYCAPINCSFVAVKKISFLENGGFCFFLHFGEDFDLWVRLSLIGNIAYLNKPLSYSNQDVNLNNRAIGGYKLYRPENHFIFNLSYLQPYEQQLPSLKRLLDGLRVRSLIPYYLSGSYSSELLEVLSLVDFKLQPPFYQFVYRFPLWSVKLFFTIKRLGSRAKHIIYRMKVL
ncbi:glycosyltransferase family 2 protein [Larkinella bovis]|uniref:Glycosyltransferase family 2 protein n=1 Tax=Larkinella bovis TaxID=683041 RepID=A0ABW0IJS6_9BACT